MTETESQITQFMARSTESREDRYREESRVIGRYCMQFSEPGYSRFILGYEDVAQDKQRTYDRMDQTQRSAVLAYTALPEEPEARVRLLKAAEQAIDGRFSDASLVISEYMRNPTETRSAWKEDWRDVVRYDPSRIEIDEETQRTMDKLNFYLKVQQGVNRGRAIDIMVKQAVRTGLLTEEQSHALKLSLADALNDAHFRDSTDAVTPEKAAMVAQYKGDTDYEDDEEEQLTENQAGALSDEQVKSGGQFIERHGNITKRKKRNRDTILSSEAKRDGRWQAGNNGRNSYRQEVINKLKLRNAPDNN